MYSWNDTDFPRELPLDLSTPFEYAYTEHLDYFGLSDSPVSIAAWASLVGNSIGFINLGPNNRRFALSMFHQLHCLTAIRKSLQEGSGGGNDHLAHCVNYLMEMILCSARPTLELAIPNVPPTGTTHVCRDWTKVYKYLEEKHWK